MGSWCSWMMSLVFSSQKVNDFHTSIETHRVFWCRMMPWSYRIASWSHLHAATWGFGIANILNTWSHNPIRGLKIHDTQGPVLWEMLFYFSRDSPVNGVQNHLLGGKVVFHPFRWDWEVRIFFEMAWNSPPQKAKSWQANHCACKCCPSSHPCLHETRCADWNVDLYFDWCSWSEEVVRKWEGKSNPFWTVYPPWNQQFAPENGWLKY